MVIANFSLTPDGTTRSLSITDRSGINPNLQLTSLGGGDGLSTNVPHYLGELSRLIDITRTLRLVESTKLAAVKIINRLSDFCFGIHDKGAIAHDWLRNWLATQKEGVRILAGGDLNTSTCSTKDNQTGISCNPLISLDLTLQYD